VTHPPAPAPNVVTFPATPGAAGEAPRLDSAALAALVDGRLRRLRAVCAALLGCVALQAAGSVLLVRGLAARPLASIEPALIVTVLAAVLILAASRSQAAILARAGRPTLAEDLAGPARAAGVIGAYSWSTVVAFVLLFAAASFGLLAAGLTATVRYALVICAAAALGMLARWPRRAAVLRLLRQRGLA